MKKFMLVGCLLSAAMGLNTAFSSSHTDQIEVEFNKNNIYEEFTDEIEIPNSDKYFINEETEPDLIIESIVQAAFSEFINKANYLLGIER